MTDFHVITPEAVELVMQVIDGELVIVPPEAEQAPEPAPNLLKYSAKSLFFVVAYSGFMVALKCLRSTVNH